MNVFIPRVRMNKYKVVRTVIIFRKRYIPGTKQLTFCKLLLVPPYSLGM